MYIYIHTYTYRYKYELTGAWGVAQANVYEPFGVDRSCPDGRCLPKPYTLNPIP